MRDPRAAALHSGVQRKTGPLARRLAGRDESGAVLILALVFLVVAALALVGLVVFSGTQIVNTSNLKKQRGLDYAVNSATQIAIQAVRYSPNYYGGLPGSPPPAPQNCLGQTRVAFSATGQPTLPPTTPRAFEISVDCQGTATSPIPIRSTATVTMTGGSNTVTTTTLFGSATTTFVGYEITDKTDAIPATTVILKQDPSTGTVTLSAAVSTTVYAPTKDVLMVHPLVERTVTFFACERPTATATTCSGTNYLVRATVEFNDVSATPLSTTHPDLCGGETPTGTPTTVVTTTCGTSMIVTKWLVSYANG